MKTSIIITTYNRPEFLRECVLSALAQTLKPFEIIIGDDSLDDVSKPVIPELQSIAAEKNISLLYFHHKPSLNQSQNIEFLIQKARGDLICLIHDDDLLLPNCLADLVPTFDDPSVVAAYGKQKILSHEGIEDTAASENLNKNFRRTQAFEGLQPDTFESSLTQQFPNNGWIVRADIAKKVGYAHLHKTFGDACDFGFGLFLSFETKEKFYFKNSYTACYRLSNNSLWRNNPKSNFAYFSFKFVANDPRINRSLPYVQKWLRQRAPSAIAEATHLDHKQEAREWLFGRWHRAKLLTPGGIKRLLKITFSN